MGMTTFHSSMGMTTFHGGSKLVWRATRGPATCLQCHDQFFFSRMTPGFFSRPVGSNCRRPVSVNRTGLTDNRKKAAKFKFKKKDSSTGFHRLAARIGPETAPI